MSLIKSQKDVSLIDNILACLILRFTPDKKLIYVNNIEALNLLCPDSGNSDILTADDFPFIGKKFNAVVLFLSDDTPEINYKSFISGLYSEKSGINISAKVIISEEGNPDYYEFSVSGKKTGNINNSENVNSNIFREFFNESGTYGLVLDQNGYVVAANEKLQKLLEGKNLTSRINWFDDIIPADVNEKLKQKYGLSVKIKSSDTLPDNFYLTDRSGETIEIRWNGFFIENNSGGFYTGFTGRPYCNLENEYEDIKIKEKRFRALYDSLPAGILIQNQDEKITMVNRFAASFFKKSKSEIYDKKYPQPEIRFFDETGKEVKSEEFNSLKSLKTGTSHHNYIRRITNTISNETKWVLINSEPVFDADSGKIKETVISFLDITKLKTAEEKLVRHTSELSKRIKTIECLYNINKLFSGEEYHGIGTIVIDFMAILANATEEPESVCFKMMLNGKTWFHGDYENSAFPGEWLLGKKEEVFGNFYAGFNTNSEKTSFFDDEITLLDNAVSLLNEYLAAKNAEKKLAESEKGYRTLVETSPDGICRVNLEGKVTYANRQFEKLFPKKSRENIIGSGIDKYFDLNERKKLFANIENLQIGKSKKNLELSILRENDKPLPVELSITLMSDLSGNPSEYIIIFRDLREKIKRKEQVRQHRERLALALDATSDAIWDWKINKSKGFYSKRFYSMFGYKPDEFLTEINKWKEYLHPEDAPRVLHCLSEYVETRRDSFAEEFRLKCKDGSYKWVLGRGKIIETDENSKVKRIIGTYQDITERKESEIKVRESEEKLRAVFNQTFQFTALLNRNGQVISVNSTALDFTGISLSDIKGEYFWNTPWWQHSEVEKEKLRKAVYNSFDGTESRYYTTLIKSTGQIFDFDFTLKPIISENNKINYLLAEARDISEILRTEFALKQSEEELIEAQKLSNTGSWKYVVSEDKLYWSDQLYSIFEKDKFTYHPDFNSFLQPVNKNDAELLEKSDIKNTWKNLPFELEFTVDLPHTKSKFIHLIGKHKIKDNRVYEIVGTVQDITERKIIEQELVNAREQALKSDRLKSEFLAQMSHEIRTPINILLSSSTLIEEFVRKRVDDDILMLFNGMRRAGKRIIRTIDLILNMSELQTGTYNLFMREIDIYSEILQSLAIEFRNNAIEKHLDFELINSYGSNTVVEGDEYTLRQIFANLIHNAIKYTNKGSIKVILEADRNDNLVVSVADTGIGISQEYLEDIFEPFSQEDQGYTRKYEGNGLGLALVKKYCDLNHAEITVNSQKNSGTTFRVIIPPYLK